MTADELRHALAAALGDPARVSTGDSDRTLHGEDLSFHRPHPPDVVVYATSTEDVAAVLALAHEHRIPVVPFGAGSSLEGHVIPVHGGISLDLTRMDEILAIRPEDLTATVQAGVTRLQLERRLAEHGLHFPVDPGADATLGGMAATNAAGTTSVRYGKMRAGVRALRAVLPGGRTIATGTRAAKTSAGYDLTGVLVGSEGTLGVITELTLAVHGIPTDTVVLRASFEDIRAACRAAATIVAAGIPVTRLELIDDFEVGALNRHAGARLPDGHALFVELAGAREAVDAELPDVRAILEDEGAHGLVEERDPTRRSALWRARHNLFFAEQALAPGKASMSTDVCVPISELADAVAATRAAIDRRGLLGGIVAHAGDGNIHVGLLIDPDELARADDLRVELVADALARGGTCTGEHGIGLGKLAALQREHGDSLDLMAAIKRAFDPRGIMNPGKVLRLL